MTARENVIRAIRFETPDHVPVAVGISPACWSHYPKEFLWDMVASHPLAFPWFAQADETLKRRIENPVFRPEATKGVPYRDPWGCVWETTENGLVGTVTRHPVESWDALPTLSVPDPDRCDGMHRVDWNELAEARDQARREGTVFMTGLPHGHTFLRLCDLRGYENFVLDMVEGGKEVSTLIAMVRDFNLAVLAREVRLSPDLIAIPEDLGMQVGPMLSPEQFNVYIAPCYEAYVELIRQNSNALIHMHSDGDIRALAGRLLEIGIDVLNLQDLVNGIDWIEANLKGKVCIDLDIDRQSITRFGSPSEIDALIREEVSRLGTKAGGLMMIYGLYPGIPERNIKVLLDAIERYAFYFS